MSADLCALQNSGLLATVPKLANFLHKEMEQPGFFTFFIFSVLCRLHQRGVFEAPSAKLALDMQLAYRHLLEFVLPLVIVLVQNNYFFW